MVATLHYFIDYEPLKILRVNLVIMIATLHSFIDYELLKILRVYEGTCFGHVMSKACQYVTNDDNIFVGLRNVNVKKIQSGL
jgi:hypothetical protein